MASAISELTTLSYEEQVSILSRTINDNLYPIQINKNIYLIPKDVHEFIDEIFRELDLLREERKHIGKKKYKK